MDFFDKNDGHILERGVLIAEDTSKDAEIAEPDADESDEKDETTTKYMTPEELHKMRMDIMPQLL